MNSPAIAENLERIHERIGAACTRAGRRQEDIVLLAVTKTVEENRIREARAAGLYAFGENYVQEARVKIPALNAELEAEWHLIGHLQTNKAKYCPALFDLVQTVDSLGLAEELSRVASKQGKAVQRILIEVNLADDPDRPGIAATETLALSERVAALPSLSLEGLMGIAPAGGDAEAARPHFRRLRGLWETLPEERRRILSMGMSGDFEVAIEEGATLIRIGTAIFGHRQSQG